MKRWHALAACAAAALALVIFRAWSSPERAAPRTALAIEAAVREEPPEQAPAPEPEPSRPPEAPAPPPAPKAPSPPKPAVVEAVEARPAGEDAAEAWNRIVAAELTDDEKAAVDRHLARFVRPPAPEAREEVALLPKADPDAAEKRRIEQLELLRQRKALGLLDHIGQGLAWLALHQGPDGRISDASVAARCAELGHDPACARNPNFEGYAGAAATGLAVVAMLDFRDQDMQGVFEPTLARAVTWLRGQQREDGTFLGRAHYATAISLLALGQAAAASGSEDLRKSVERGLRELYAQRGPDGGYQYRAGDPGDVSVSPWVAQAIEAARGAKAEIPPGMEPDLRGFIDAVWTGDARFRYQAHGRERPTLFPAGMLLCLIERDEQRAWAQDAVLDSWRQWLREAPKKQKWGTYTTYYAARVVIRLEPELPEEWAREILALAARQRPPGPAAGSFEGTLGAGTVVETALSLLTLEHALYKR